MELFYEIITIINNVILGIFGAAFMLQFVYMLLFFLPAKKYKPAVPCKKIAILIPARNEEKVIENSVKSALLQNYPKELFDVFVVADNCTDNTANLARECGATVLEHFDEDEKHHRVSYALKFAFDILLKDYNYDAFVRLDADSMADSNYLQKMNDALVSGVKLARGYNNSNNLGQNLVTKISGLWYLRDARFGCQPRSFFGISQILVGPGMMISADILQESNGWNEMGISEDADFCLAQLLKGQKSCYVKDAIVYDEQPCTISDVNKRNMRMGRGLFTTFFKKGIPCLGKFLITFKFSYLDAFLTEMFIPVDLLAVAWMPFYYVFALVYNSVIGNLSVVYTILQTIGISLVFGFIVPFIFQAVLVVITERKRINYPIHKLINAVVLLPMFMIIYAIGIFLGIVTNAKWKPINRSGTDASKFITQSTKTAKIIKLVKSDKTLKKSSAKTKYKVTAE